jgi:hypothetical protein
MYKKVSQHGFLKDLWLYYTPKKLIMGHFLRTGSGSGPIRPDPIKKVWIRPDQDPQHWLEHTVSH